MEKSEILDQLLKALDHHFGFKAFTIAEKIGFSAGYLSKLRSGKIKDEEKVTAALDLIGHHYVDWVEIDSPAGNFRIKNQPPLPLNQARPVHIEFHDGAPSFQFELVEALKKHGGSLKIIDTWIPQLLEEDAANLSRLAEHADEIQILLLHPDSHLVGYRSQALGVQPEEARQRLIRNVQQITGYRGSGKVAVRLYNEFPGFNLYILDQEIYYGGFLSIDYSQNTFFHRVMNGNSKVAGQLRDHFSKLWVERSVEVTPELRRKLEDGEHTGIRLTATTAEAIVERLGGVYNIYNLDESEELPYQVSRLEVDETGCRLYYLERIGDREEKLLLEAEIFDHLHLLLIGRGSHFILQFLGFIGTRRRPDVIEMLYIHSDSRDRPRAARALLRRLDTRYRPSRYPASAPEIDPFIREYLSQQPTSLQIPHPANRWSDLEVKRSNYYRRIEKYAGRWRLYCHQRYSRARPDLNANHWIGAVAASVLHIEKEPDSADLVCRLEIELFPEYSGRLQWRGLPNQPYLICELFSEEKDRYINFLFFTGLSADEQDTLYGTFNTTYPDEPNLGCGLVVLKRVPLEGDLPPATIDPLEGNNPADLPFINFLAFRDPSCLVLDSEHRHLSANPLPYAGVYRLYSYGSRPRTAERCITRSALEILPFGFVQFHGFHPAFRADGRAFVHADNLHIHLRNRNNGRPGYFIIQVGQMRPEPGRLYTGLFNGVSIRNGRPVASRVVLQHTSETLDQIPTEKIPLFSEAYRQLPPGIRRTLTGRIPNFMGFFRKDKLFHDADLQTLAERQDDLGLLFMQNACIYLLQPGDRSAQPVESALDLLYRAAEYGFSDLDRFRTAIQDSLHYPEIVNHPRFIALERRIKRGD